MIKSTIFGSIRGLSAVIRTIISNEKYFAHWRYLSRTLSELPLKISKFEFLVLTDIYPKDLRLTLDYQEDLEFAREIFSKLKTFFSKDDVLNLLNNEPKLIDLIKNIHDSWNKNYENNKGDLRLK